MSPFDYLAVILAIPMGLALVELAQGFSVTLRRRHEIKVGLLTPLLGVYMLLILTAAWLSLWKAQDMLVVERSTVFFGLLISVVFYIAASFAVPDRPEKGTDLDDWFLANRRFSLGGTFLLVTLVEIYLGQRFTTWPDQTSIGNQIGYIIGFSMRPAFILGVILLPKKPALIVLMLLIALEVAAILT